MEKKKNIRRAKKLSVPGQSILKWFFVSFSSMAIAFLITLFPLITYCRNMFVELELEKCKQHLDNGINYLDNVADSVNSSSQMLLDDSRFLFLRYANGKYDSVDYNVQTQLMHHLKGLTFPQTLITDCVLQLSENVAVTPKTAFFNGFNNYYPTYFSVDGLGFEEWDNLIREQKNDYLPVKHIKTLAAEYDALTYVTSCGDTAVLFVCLNIENIREQFVSKTDFGDCIFSITKKDGSVLFEESIDSTEKYFTVTQQSSLHNFKITVQMPETVITERLKPLYILLSGYCGLTMLILICSILICVWISSSPLLNLISILAHEDGHKHDRESQTKAHVSTKSIRYGFHFIQNYVNETAKSLEQYQDTVDTQRKVLQAQFLKKAIDGQLVSSKDRASFNTNFPNFPDEYCLVLLHFWEHDVNPENAYAEPFSLLQSFVNIELPNAYQLLLNEMEILLVIARQDLEMYRKSLDFLIDNINRMEPSYSIRGYASGVYSHQENLPSAYHQLMKLDGIVFAESSSKVCEGNIPNSGENDNPRAITLSLYTAISYGNQELSFQMLKIYEKPLKEGNRSTYELISSILNCIKLEHPVETSEIWIPPFGSDKDMYETLKNVITAICKTLSKDIPPDSDPFLQAVLEYIDAHYFEYGLCLAFLAEQFNCSQSKIQKAIKISMGITISEYIEKKRMALANELLLQGKKSITEIALACGFSNSNSFYKAYQRVCGYAPSITKRGGNK